MSKKLTILFITTFIIALVFFSSYFVIQKARGVAINIQNDLNMNSNLVKGFLDTYDGPVSSPVNKNYSSCFEQICFRDDTALRAGQPFCVTNSCEINDFSWCVTDSFYPPNDFGCFTADTPILMADGKYKPIKDVREGDWVLTKENENSNKMVSAKVAKTFVHTVNSYLVINNELEATDNHPIFVNGNWKQAGKIELGDKLFNEKGEEVIVKSLEIKKETIKVYNLEIEDYATYFAGGIYVHNKPEPGPLPQ